MIIVMGGKTRMEPKAKKKPSRVTGQQQQKIRVESYSLNMVAKRSLDSESHPEEMNVSSFTSRKQQN